MAVENPASFRDYVERLEQVSGQTISGLLISSVRWNIGTISLRPKVAVFQTTGFGILCRRLY